MVDYYEFLQISPNADADTIHRVYRFLAARLHPDNPESGDIEMFHLLKGAYDVLSDPAARAEYDARRKAVPDHENPFSEEVDFMDSMDGELNRRLAVLAVLYYRRRTNPHVPEVGLGEIETRMGFPRDYLDFTIWYLYKKGYVTKGDNAQLALTAEGVDFIETQRANLPVLNKLLTSGGGHPAVEAARANRQQQTQPSAAAQQQPVFKGSVSSEPDKVRASRRNGPDRRVGLPDLRVVKVERRKQVTERRTEKAERRKEHGRRATD